MQSSTTNILNTTRIQHVQYVCTLWPVAVGSAEIDSNTSRVVVGVDARKSYYNTHSFYCAFEYGWDALCV